MDQNFYLAIMSSIEKEVLLNLGSSMYLVRLDICWGTSGGNMKVVERSVGMCLVYPVHILKYHAKYRYPVRSGYEYEYVLEVPVLHRY